MTDHDEIDADELLEEVARRYAEAGIEFTAECRRFLKELLYAITLQQQLARRIGKPVPDTLDLLRAWDERLDRVAADDPANLFDCLKSLAESIEMTDTAEGASLCPDVREQTRQFRAEALELLELFRKEVGVERCFRDARAASVMAPTTDVLYDFIGKAVCGMSLF
jgi:alkylation response protein AidB-like acyl-CoA dehydrogenase